MLENLNIVGLYEDVIISLFHCLINCEVYVGYELLKSMNIRRNKRYRRMKGEGEEGERRRRGMGYPPKELW